MQLFTKIYQFLASFRRPTPQPVMEAVEGGCTPDEVFDEPPAPGNCCPLHGGEDVDIVDGKGHCPTCNIDFDVAKPETSQTGWPPPEWPQDRPILDSCGKISNYSELVSLLQDLWGGLYWREDKYPDLDKACSNYSDDTLECQLVDMGDTPLILRGDLLRAKRSLDRAARYLADRQYDDDVKSLSPAFEAIDTLLKETKDLKRYMTPETSSEAPLADSRYC